jgi:FAD/FMN-containing dehydrogenase
MSIRLPPGISQNTLDGALRAFESALGKEWVFSSEEDVALYRDAYSPLRDEPEERLASAAIAPSTVEEVQAVVRIANERRIPLYPISTGRNLGYGGAAPALSGSVVLDLKRMNRILDVSESNASALVEPGVSYFDLYRHIHERGLKVWLDPPDPGWGSLIGNALDRGGGQTAVQYRNHFDAHCGMEVVLADGDVLRTGMGALPNSESWQQFKTGFGPWVDGMFSQSNFGVVTKMGFWLMPQPEAYLSGRVVMYKHADLIPFVDIMNYLENASVFSGMTLLGSPLLGNDLPGALPDPPTPELAELLATPGGPQPAQLEAYCKKVGKGLWSGRFQFYGPREVIEAQWKYCKKRFSAIEGVSFEDGELLEMPLSAQELERRHTVIFGVPNLRIFTLMGRTENSTGMEGHVGFSPIIPRNGKAIYEAQKVFTEAAREFGLPLSPLNMPLTYWQRAFVYIFLFPVTRDVETNRRNREAFRKLVKICADHGWGEYRTPVAYQDDVMETYSFNNHALRRFHERLKDAVDPNGILSAGRYGIWPRYLREKKA